MTITEILVSAFLLAGALVMLLATTGMLRFGDVFLRMHAATKSSTVGVGMIVIGVAIFFGDLLVAAKLLALAGIYFFVAATGAQVMGSASHAARIPMVKETWIDELAHNKRVANETLDAPEETLPTVKD